MTFLLICVIIFLGSLVAGFLPFALYVGEQQIGLLSGFGAGLLVSTALAIILPEGMEAFSHAQEDSGRRLPHALVGCTIVAGFAVMLLIDHVQGGSSHIRHLEHHESDDEEAVTALVPPTADASRTLKKQQDSGSRAFVGLLVHSLADGVAVGTTGVSDKEELKLVVAFAMVLHKLPATFGLVSFLITAKWQRASIRRALLAFAASAPLMALATYWLLVAIPGLSSPSAVALWLLASGGTFLYASCMHVLPHVATVEHCLTNGQVIAILCGCGIPLLVQLVGGHVHH